MNHLDQEESLNKADETLHTQREKAIKEEINHQEKFREQYESRLVANKARLESTKNDQKPEYQKLLNFDEKRIKYFEGGEEQEQKKLKDTMADDAKDKIALLKTVSTLEADISKLESRIKVIKTGMKMKVKILEGKAGNLHKLIGNNDTLDKTRDMIENHESKIANSNE